MTSKEERGARDERETWAASGEDHHLPRQVEWRQADERDIVARKAGRSAACPHQAADGAISPSRTRRGYDR
jgi:hypothetical protein